MAIFWFVVGIACGFGAKLGADKYREWQDHDKVQKEQIGEWLVELRAMEKLRKERGIDDMSPERSKTL